MKNKIAEFIGIMLGDGSIGKYFCRAGDKIKVQHVVKVTLDSRNEKYTKHVKKIFEEILGISSKLSYKKNENTVDIRTFHKKIFDYVTQEIKLIQSPKWNKMEVPEKYFKKEFSSYIVKGLFDTDGCLSVFNNNGKPYPRIEIKICPSPAQKQILFILEELGFRVKVKKIEKGKICLRISGLNELKRWFNLIGSSNPIHIQKYEKLFKTKNL